MQGCEWCDPPRGAGDGAVTAGSYRTSRRAQMSIAFRETGDLPREQVLALYQALGWSSAQKPDLLQGALVASDAVVTAWDRERLIGLGNAISDRHLVVYYPHLLVHPDYQGRGIGTQLMKMLMERYRGFHQQALLADGRAIEFYRRMGFTRAGSTEPMWIYDGHDHD
jgi:GNAT superfamily N-acetyltransferase